MVLSNIYYTTIYILVHLLFHFPHQTLAKKSWLPSSFYSGDPSHADDQQNQFLDNLLLAKNTPFFKRELTKGATPSFNLHGNNELGDELIKDYLRFTHNLRKFNSPMGEGKVFHGTGLNWKESLIPLADRPLHKRTASFTRNFNSKFVQDMNNNRIFKIPNVFTGYYYPIWNQAHIPSSESKRNSFMSIVRA